MFLHGFILLEVLIVTALVLATLMLAAPDMQRLWQIHSLQTHAQKIAHTFLMARSDAIRRQHNVHLCAANLKRNLQLQGCQSGRTSFQSHWQHGLLAYTDAQGQPNRHYDSGEQVHLVMFKSPSIAVQASAVQWTVTPDGRMEKQQQPEFHLYSANRRYCITVTVPPSGRPNQSEVYACPQP